MSLPCHSNRRRVLPRNAPANVVEALVTFQQLHPAAFSALADYLDACRDDLHERLEDMTRPDAEARSDRAGAAVLGDVLAILREAPTLREAMRKAR